MFDLEKANELLKSQKKKIEEQKKLIAAYLETLSNSTLGLQVDKGAIDTLVAMTMVNDNMTFQSRVMSDCGCDERAYLLSLRKFTLREGLESATQNLKATDRAMLVEAACKDNTEKYNALIEIIKSNLEN